MYGIVSLLDDIHDAMVQQIWQEFQANFGVHGVHKTPVPHFSYHVAEMYHTELLNDAILPIVSDFPSFTVQTAGLGIFTGPEPVLYIPVRLNQALDTLNRKLWDALLTSCTGVNELYHPDKWVPHITLAQGDVDHELLPHVIQLLSTRNFYWQIHVQNIVLLGSDEGEIDTVHTRFSLVDS